MGQSLKIALIGYGKMGKAIEEIAIERGHRILLRISSQNQDDFSKENISECDVAIEFTNPQSAVVNIKKCLEYKIPVVSGSTGWLENLPGVKKCCEENDGTFLYASNFSIGVNIFFEVNKKLAKLMSAQKDYDVSIEEIHHTQKKDAPSGTAITIAEQILAEVERKSRWVNENRASASTDLMIISKRIDPAPGTHSVKYSSSIDDIEITHTAHNRKGFALGAVIAAEFIYKKKGIFTMQEVLGL